MGASVPCGLQPWGPGQVPKALAARGPVLSREKNLALGQGQRSPGGTPGPQCLVARLLCVGGCWRTRALVSPSLPTERPKRKKKEPSSAHIAWRKNFHTAPSRALLSPSGSPFREVPFRGTVVNGIPAALSVGIMRAPAPPPQVTRRTRICAAPAGGALPSTLRYFLGGGTHSLAHAPLAYRLAPATHLPFQEQSWQERRGRRALMRLSVGRGLEMVSRVVCACCSVPGRAPQASAYH